MVFPPAPGTTSAVAASTAPWSNCCIPSLSSFAERLVLSFTSPAPEVSVGHWGDCPSICATQGFRVNVNPPCSTPYVFQLSPLVLYRSKRLKVFTICCFSSPQHQDIYYTFSNAAGLIGYGTLAMIYDCENTWLPYPCLLYYTPHKSLHPDESQRAPALPSFKDWAPGIKPPMAATLALPFRLLCSEDKHSHRPWNILKMTTSVHNSTIYNIMV